MNGKRSFWFQDAKALLEEFLPGKNLVPLLAGRPKRWIPVYEMNRLVWQSLHVQQTITLEEGSHPITTYENL
jgi:hypothetical protein